MKAEVAEIEGEWFAGCDVRWKVDEIQVPGDEVVGANPHYRYSYAGQARYLCCFWAGPFATE